MDEIQLKTKLIFVFDGGLVLEVWMRAGSYDNFNLDFISTKHDYKIMRFVCVKESNNAFC